MLAEDRGGTRQHLYRPSLQGVLDLGQSCRACIRTAQAAHDRVNHFVGRIATVNQADQGMVEQPPGRRLRVAKSAHGVSGDLLRRLLDPSLFARSSNMAVGIGEEVDQTIGQDDPPMWLPCEPDVQQKGLEQNGEAVRDD